MTAMSKICGSLCRTAAVLLVLMPAYVATYAQRLTGYPSAGPADQIVMYYAGSWRPKWTTENVMPYVMHTFADGHRDWFFSGFKLVDTAIDGYSFVPAEKNPPSHMKQWIALQDRAFTPGRCLYALEEAIEQARVVLGTPPFRHKVIAGLPNPIPGQTDWGVVGRKQLDFNNMNDRLTAVKWYIDTYVERFKQAGFRQIDLEGFSWMSENTTQSDDLIKAVAKYVHRLGYRFYWVPYYNSPRRFDWRELGFDEAYLQPNYYFHTKLPLSRLDDACVDAREHGMGLEIEFDDRHFKDFETYKNRLHDYLDAFERYGVYDTSSIVYYDANAAFLKLSRSDRDFDRQLLDRMAALVARRQYGLPVKPQAVNTDVGSGSNKGKRQRPTDWRDPEYWHF